MKGKSDIYLFLLNESQLNITRYLLFYVALFAGLFLMEAGLPLHGGFVNLPDPVRISHWTNRKLSRGSYRDSAFTAFDSGKEMEKNNYIPSNIFN